MKTKIFLITSIFSLLLSGCADIDRSSAEVEDENIIYPVEIEITEFSLDKFFDNRQNPKLDSVYLINSEEELSIYFPLHEVPEIDFEKYSLLFVSLKDYNIDSEIVKQLFRQTSINEYELHLDIIPSLTANAKRLDVASLTSKLSSEATIELIVTMVEADGETVLPPCNPETNFLREETFEAVILKEAPPSDFSSYFIICEENTVYLRKITNEYSVLGEICNYPQYAKDWEIPEEGLLVLLKGNVYEYHKRVPMDGSLIFFDLELLTIKKGEKL
ncbi:MAG: hypothetical protein LBG15_03560 [Dysgonamonadaceae bacterium]|jgi:hypothetical protein|nr:hypothetical protein [Dysgonamonadaceae bacterium]